jgi:tryptophanyl-tRNA synthetase
MPRVFSGIQPTGEAPHIGNYLGALRWWVEDQHLAESFYCVVDLHALTVPQDPVALRQATLNTATILLAVGIDPEVATLFVQSHVPEHTELTWLLECTASMGELRRMTQFKDKTLKEGEEAARCGLFTYPVLMVADILLYDTDRVPVGDDQRQHLELTRDLAIRWNHRYGPTFVVPEAAIPAADRGARVTDLQDPNKKMSKSAESAAGIIWLSDPPRVIEQKIKRAVTDSDRGPDSVRWDPDHKPGVAGLLELLALATGRTPQAAAGDYDNYGRLKADTAEAVIALLAPIQERYRQLAGDPGGVTKVLAAGAEHAREVASSTLLRARRAIGLLDR